MATVKELLEIARGELGTKESPANSNRVKYSSWYGLTGPWCVMFIMWTFHYAGVALPTRTASCTTLMKAAKAAGCWVTSGYRAGDVVIFDWDGDKVPDHCGIVEYDETVLRARCRRCEVRIEGEGLHLTALTLGELAVEGDIRSVAFLPGEEGAE